MLMELLSKAATVAMLSFVVSSMLAMGAGLTVSRISEPLRNVRLVVLALLANFVLMPLGALALAKMLWLDRARLDFQRQPHPVGMFDHRSQHRQGSASFRHPRNPRGTSIYRVGLWDWLVARRT